MVNLRSISDEMIEAPSHAPLKRDLKTLRLTAAIGWMIVIMLLCWLPNQVVHKVESSSSWFEIHHFDKAIHCGIFVVFAVLWVRVWPSTRWYIWVGLMGLGLAAVTEVGQMVPMVGRDGNLADAATDILGCVIGLGLAPAVEPFLRMIERRFFGSSNP